MPGWSPYNYTLDNPVNLIDPDGREPGPGPMWNDYSAIGLRGYSQIYFQNKSKPDPWTIKTFFGSVNLPNQGVVNAHILHVGSEDFMFSSHTQMAIYANAIDWAHFDETHDVRFNDTSTYQGKIYKIGERPVTLTEVRNNIAAIEELSCNCGAVLMGVAGATASRYSNIEDILENPNLLKNQSPTDVSKNIGSHPNWRETTLGKGSNKGGG